MAIKTKLFIPNIEYQSISSIIWFVSLPYPELVKLARPKKYVRVCVYVCVSRNGRRMSRRWCGGKIVG